MITAFSAERPRQQGAGSGSGPSAAGWQGEGGADNGAIGGDDNTAGRDAGTREPGGPLAEACQASATRSDNSSLQESSTPSGSRMTRSGASASTAPSSWVTSTIAPR